MKKLLYATVATAAIGLLGASHLITQDQALVSGVLSELKFESLPGTPGLVGAPPKFQVSQKTLDHLQRMLKERKHIEVQNNGSLTVVEAKR